MSNVIKKNKVEEVFDSKKHSEFELVMLTCMVLMILVFYVAKDQDGKTVSLVLAILCGSALFIHKVFWELTRKVLLVLAENEKE